MKLTESQLKVLKALIIFVKNNDYAPTVRELMIITGFSSTSTIANHLNALDRTGYITMEKFKSRTIKLNVEKITYDGLTDLL